MKTHLLRNCLVALAAATAGYAQSSLQMQVTVPFDFIAGSQTLAAGRYAVDQATVPGMVIITSVDHQGAAIVNTNARKSADVQKVGKLVFKHYGDLYFLSEIWTPGSDYGRQLLVTNRERELAAQQAIHHGTTIAASR